MLDGFVISGMLLAAGLLAWRSASWKVTPFGMVSGIGLTLAVTAMYIGFSVRDSNFELLHLVLLLSLSVSFSIVCIGMHAKYRYCEADVGVESRDLCGNHEDPTG